MDHLSSDCKVWPCVAGGVVAGLTAGAIIAHLWVPSWCQKGGKCQGGASKRKTPSLKITYFNIQGVAEKVRLALVLSGIPFEDERVTFEQWGTMKASTPYGQLPLMKIDGGRTVTQSAGMLNYVGGLGDGSLYPSCPKKRLAIDEVIGLAGDFDKAWLPAFYLGMRPANFGYPEDFNKTDEGKEKIKAMREEFVATKLQDFLGHYTKFLKANKFFCGDHPTIADCQILPQLARFASGGLDHVPADCLEGHPEIVAWMTRMRAIPAIKAWYGNK